jgi:hypothetical protein
VALATSGCGGGSATAAPSNPGATGGLGAAASALASLRSYDFTMTLSGDAFATLLSTLGSQATPGNAPFTVSGTIVLKPEKAAELTLAGFHMIEIGGYDYMDVGSTGNFDRIELTGGSRADKLAPATMFSGAIKPSTVGGYEMIGSDTKNGLATDHYRATDAALVKLGAIADIVDATWAADVWIAHDGGYPVSMAIVGKGADSKVVYEILLDITNVNNPANGVTAPSNVTGA